MVFQTEKAMEEVGDKIDAADKTAVEEDLKALKELVEKTNPEDMTDAQIDDLKAGKEKLMNSAQKLFAKVYEQAQVQQAQQVQARIWGRRQAAAQQALSRMMMWLTETTERSNISDI